MELVQCVSCGTRTLPEIAARDWPEGVCELCRMPVEERAVLGEQIAEASWRFRQLRAGAWGPGITGSEGGKERGDEECLFWIFGGDEYAGPSGEHSSALRSAVSLPQSPPGGWVQEKEPEPLPPRPGAGEAGAGEAATPVQAGLGLEGENSAVAAPAARSAGRRPPGSRRSSSMTTTATSRAGRR